jgi:hypothetical protein
VPGPVADLWGSEGEAELGASVDADSAGRASALDLSADLSARAASEAPAGEEFRPTM